MGARDRLRVETAKLRVVSGGTAASPRDGPVVNPTEQLAPGWTSLPLIAQSLLQCCARGLHE